MQPSVRQNKISHARRVIKVLKDEIPRDVRRLRKERMDGDQKTNGGAPYQLRDCHTLLGETRIYNDLPSRVGVDPEIAENLFTTVWTNHTYTTAQVLLAGDLLEKSGIGVTKRSPNDSINVEAGARIAVRRALEDWMRKQ